jgi:hypothetical protein
MLQSIAPENRATQNITLFSSSGIKELDEMNSTDGLDVII